MTITQMPFKLVHNFTQSIRLLGLIGLFTIGFMWDAVVMTQNSDTSSQQSIYQCHIKRSSNKNGFHREVRTSMTIPETLFESLKIRENMQIYMREHIPSGLYVDLYQTKAAEDFGGPKVYSALDIDVEKPEYSSPAHSVHVFSTLVKTGSLYHMEVMLPIHLRYHRPSTEHSHDQIILDAPLVFFNVTEGGEMMVDTNLYEQAVCDSTGRTLCWWKKLSCNFEPVGGVLQFRVPVGQIDHATIVVFLTLSITIFSTLFLAHSILKKKPKILKEQ